MRKWRLNPIQHFDPPRSPFIFLPSKAPTRNSLIADSYLHSLNPSTTFEAAVSNICSFSHWSLGNQSYIDSWFPADTKMLLAVLIANSEGNILVERYSHSKAHNWDTYFSSSLSLFPSCFPYFDLGSVIIYLLSVNFYVK